MLPPVRYVADTGDGTIEHGEAALATSEPTAGVIARFGTRGQPWWLE